MEVDIDGDRRMIRASEGTLLLPGHRETFYMDPDTRTRHGWFNSRSGTLSEVGLELLKKIPEVFPLSSRMRDMLQLMEPLYLSSGPLEQQERDFLAHALLCQLIQMEAQPSEPYQGVLPPPLKQAIRFMETEVQNDLAVPDIAAAAGVSPAHLIRLFQKHLSQTPMRKLWDLRVHEGRRYLENTGWSHAEIAYQCGFKSPAHFARKMKEAYGVSARELRKQAWKA